MHLVQVHHRHLLVLLFVLLAYLFLCAEADPLTPINGQGFTNGLVIIDAPSVGNPGHAGSNLNIALEVSGDGKLGSDATNPNSTSSTHFSFLEIYLVSADTNLNLTVSSGPQLLAQEPGSTVKHLNWPIPTCIVAGSYNLTFYELSTIQGQPHFTITPVAIPIQNDKSSNVPCSSTSGVAVNTVVPQPQASSPLAQPLFPGGTLTSTTPTASSSGPAFVTITLSGPLPYPVPSTVTVTPSASPTTVFVVSLTTATITETGPSGFITRTTTETAWASTAVVTGNGNNSGFLPVNHSESSRIVPVLYLVSLTVGLWTFLS